MKKAAVVTAAVDALLFGDRTQACVGVIIKRVLSISLMMGAIMALAGSVAWGEEVVEGSVARYNGPGNASDSADDIAVDDSGNVYVTGKSTGSGADYDFTTVKYSPDSNEPVWVARYNGMGNGSDLAYDIAIDDSCNVYVTGSSEGDGTGYDYVTIKYSPDSNEPLWIARYDGPVNEWDESQAIALDDSCNIYVTGWSKVNGTGYDYATIKYGPDSNEPVWVAGYNGTGNGSDGAYDIAVDGLGNIYVTGWSIGDGTGYDYATIKYGPDSNEPLWVARYNGPGNGSDLAYGIAVDDSCNVYVTGWSEGNGTGYDHTTIKYGPDSNEPVWVARYNGPGNGSDGATAVVTDGLGNIYVTGASSGSGSNFDYATIKYGPDSNEPVWVAVYNGPVNDWDKGQAIAVDDSGNVYVTGWSKGDATGDDYATIKYGPDSNEPLWIARYDGPVNKSDGAYGIAVDGSGNVYVTGESEGSGTSKDYVTVKYSQYVRKKAGVSLVMNGSFENDGGIDPVTTADVPQYWCDVDIPTSKFGGKVDTLWATYGNYSLTLYSKVGSTFVDGDMASVSQQVYLADVNEVIFDIKLSGTHSAFQWTSEKFSAVLQIDGNDVWDSKDHLPNGNGEYTIEVNDININDTGLHTLSLAMRANQNAAHSTKYLVRWDFVKFDTHCGGFGYLPEDLNYDCYVDMLDLKMLAGQWLAEDPNEKCDLLQDGIVDFRDFAFFADYWMCNTYWENWQNDNCFEMELLAGDLNDDGIVNLQDFAILTGDWMGEGNCIRGDIDHSGIVDYDDLSRLVDEWLQISWLYRL